MRLNNSLKPQDIISFLQKKVENSQGKTVYDMLTDSFEQKAYIVDPQQAERALKEFFYAFKYEDNYYQYLMGELGAMDYVLNKGVTNVETDPLKLANSVAYSMADEALSRLKIVDFKDVITSDNTPKIIAELQRQVEWHDIHDKSPNEKLNDKSLRELLVHSLNNDLHRPDPYAERLANGQTIASAWQRTLSKNNGIDGQDIGQACLEGFTYKKYHGTLGAVAFLAERRERSPRQVMENHVHGYSNAINAASLAREIIKERTLEILIDALKKAGLKPDDPFTAENLAKIKRHLMPHELQKQVLRKKNPHSR